MTAPKTVQVMAKGGLREWLPVSEACAALGKSQSTIERIPSERLRSRLEPRPGRKPERMYYASDVERIKHEDADKENHRVPAVKAPAQFAIAPDTITALVNAVTEYRNAPPAQKLWLSLEEAAAYSGLGRSILKRLAKRAGPHGAWRISRKSLEAFEG